MKALAGGRSATRSSAPLFSSLVQSCMPPGTPDRYAIDRRSGDQTGTSDRPTGSNVNRDAPPPAASSSQRSAFERSRGLVSEATAREPSGDNDRLAYWPGSATRETTLPRRSYQETGNAGSAARYAMTPFREL